MSRFKNETEVLTPVHVIAWSLYGACVYAGASTLYPDLDWNIFLMVILNIACALVLIVLPAIGIFIMMEKRACSKLQYEFNREVMEPRGLYFKIQESILGDSQAHWASIALVEPEVDRLKQEPRYLVYNKDLDAHVARPRAKFLTHVERCFGCMEREDQV